MITVDFPSAWLGRTDGNERVTSTEHSLSSLLEELERTFPQLPRLPSTDAASISDARLVVNDKVLTEGLDALMLKPGDRVSFIVPISGG